MPEPILELIFQDVEASLLAISKANGFAHDIDKVERWHLQSMDQESAVILEIRMGSDTPTGQAGLNTELNEVEAVLTMKIRHDHATDKLSTDAIFTRHRADIHRAMVGTSGARSRNGHALYTRYVGASAVEPQEDGIKGAMEITYAIAYEHVIGDMTNQAVTL